jgi:glycosyltransferase involved in cell wall biosynthesis
VLAGGVPPEAAALTARAAASPFAGRVELRGYIAPERRRDLYAGALALIMPSHTEGFGIPALEAMTVGVPVIAANRGALPEVVGDAGLLIDPVDPSDLARRLGEVVASRPLRDRLRGAGWQQAARFSWRESAARAREAWGRAIEHQRRRSTPLKAGPE